MKPLSVLDAAFLQLETRETPMHVGAVFVLDPPQGAGRDYASRLRAHLRPRLGGCEVFTRKLASMPLNLANPLWIEHGEVDLEYHVRRLRLPAPARRRAVEECVARLHARPLDRQRPLWQFHVIEGLPRGRIALYVKMHHAGLDGASAQAFMRAIIDGSPGQPAPPPDATAAGPAMSEVVSEGLRHQLGEIARLPQTLGALATATIGAAKRRLRAPARPGARPTPHTPINRVIGRARSFATCELSLAESREVAHAAGGTVNDLVLTICAGALRHYLDQRGELPEAPMSAAVPVSLREQGDEAQTIQVTFMGVDLHTDIADPRARFEAIHRSAVESKELTTALRSLIPRDLPSLGLPWLLGAIVRAVGTPALVDYAPLPFNVLVSNVPGPPQSISIAGARVLTYHPVSIPFHGVGLNITAHSYDGRLFFGLTGCRRALPDIDALARGVLAEFQTLARKTRAGPAPTPRPKAGRRAGRASGARSAATKVAKRPRGRR